MTLNYPSYFKEKENLDGKRDVYLTLNCFDCPQKELNFFKSEKCINCFLETLFNYRNRRFDYISILWNDIVINSGKFKEFIEYFKVLKIVKKTKSKIEKIRTQKCKYREFKCKVLPTISSLYQIKANEYLNPIFIHNIYDKGISSLEKVKINDPICEECHNSIEIIIKNLLKEMNKLSIIQKFRNFQQEEVLKKNRSFYEHFFSGSSLILNDLQEIQEKKVSKDKKLLDKYYLGKSGIFKVFIIENEYEIEKSYRVEFFYSGESQEFYLEKIIQDICDKITIKELTQIIPIEKLIEFYESESLKILKSKYDFSDSIGQKISFLAAIKKINLDKLFPLLIDDFIEEIFLDSPKDEIYINHQIYGRCRTEIRFTSEELDRIKALIRLYSGKRLDFKNPIIKFVIKNKYFYCRFSIDVEPIQISNFALDIRKLNKNIFTIQDLLKNRTLDPILATFLYFNILHRKNFTVTGETDTGKTTLINALDLLTPKEFRKIYVENITESLNQFEYGKHQLKYKVDSLEESMVEKYSKSTQIKNLLHRTPDIIYLGEILTKEETEAMFQCLAAGLRGFQTIHSNNIESLMNRFLYHFKINKSCLNDLDILILMKKIKNNRKVVGIFEINKSLESKEKLFNSIFEYNPQTNNWVLLKSLSKTSMFLEIIKYENLTEEKYLALIKIYNEIFDFLSNSEKIANIELIDFFHKIGYYSKISLDSLKQFWNIWKKNRGLNF
ncbi:MAG: ATPase, T2SS/T4P/T4SS family [Candidatus Thorarchaeota archaeon]